MGKNQQILIRTSKRKSSPCLPEFPYHGLSYRMGASAILPGNEKPVLDDMRLEGDQSLAIFAAPLFQLFLQAERNRVVPLCDDFFSP